MIAPCPLPVDDGSSSNSNSHPNKGGGFPSQQQPIAVVPDSHVTPPRNALSRVQPLNPTALVPPNEVPSQLAHSNNNSMNGNYNTQQQQQQAQYNAEYEEYVHTRALLAHHTPAHVLGAVLVEVLDDYPQMAGYFRAKAEKYMIAAHQQQQHNHQQMMASQGSSPSYLGGGNAQRLGGGSGRPNGGRAGQDDVWSCAIHGNTRSMKHLAWNQSAQQWECVPGFHCLESGGQTPPKVQVRPVADPHVATTPPAPAPSPSVGFVGFGQEGIGRPLSPRGLIDLEGLLSSLRSTTESYE